MRCHLSRARAPVFAVFAVLAAASIVGESHAAGGAVRKVLQFDGSVGQVTIPAKTAPNLLTPSKCRSVTYQAGSNEVAIVSVAGTVSPSVETDASLRLAVTRSTPLQPFVSVNLAAQVESMQDGTAMVSARARVSLDEGQVYQFGAGFAADEETLTSVFTCQGVVVIVSQQP